MPGSPLSVRRPGSATASRDSNVRCSQSQSPERRTSHEDLGEDDGQAYRPFTPATVRPASSVLDPIIEGASLDQDTSLGDTSIFAFSQYRFSSVYARSEASNEGLRGSTLPDMQSEALKGRTPRASSRSTDTDFQDTTAAFRPKQLLLTRASRSARRGSSQLSRSFSVPLLTFQPTYTCDRSQLGMPDTARSESVGSPSSTRAYLAATPTIAARPVSMPSLPRSSESLPMHDGGATRSTDVCRDMSELQRSSSESPRVPPGDGCEQQNASRIKTIPAKISVSRTPRLTSIMVEDDNNTGQYGVAEPLPATGRTSLLSPTELATVTTPHKDQSPSDADADQSLRSDSLTPSRSAASIETRSSETIELIPWQVATSDSTGTRRSEEIFRPLSTALTMSRSRPGSSRDTILSGSHLNAAATEAASLRSTRLTPQTPLKAGMDFIWGRSVADNFDVEGEDGSSAGAMASGCSKVGLGVFIPTPNVGLEPACTSYPALGSYARDCQVQDGNHASNVDATANGMGSRHYRISNPAGGIRRLLLELEQGRKDSGENQSGIRSKLQIRGGHSATNSQHQRSATLGSVSILPRRPSIRRRHQSFDLDGRQRARLVGNPSRSAALRTVPEHSTCDGVDSSIASRAANHAERGIHAIRHIRPVQSPDITISPEAQDAKSLGMRFLDSPRLWLLLQIFILAYQALFFTFEASYLWNTVSPALPLVASALFLILDMLIIQLHILTSVRVILFLNIMVVLVTTMTYCTGMCALKIILLVKSPDSGASAPGIHFHRGRSAGGGASQQALRDSPISAVLFVLGTFGAVCSIVVAASLSVAVLARRSRSDSSGAAS